MEKSKKTDYLKKWGLTSGEYILFVSRLIPHKGAHYLVSAFTYMQKKFPKLLGKKKLVIVGDGYYTEEYVHMLKDMTEENSKIIFTGFQSGEALAQLFSHAALMVHPSDQEGLPITVLEAMSYGTPIVLSDIPEHRELSHDDKFLFAHGDIRSLVQTLQEVMGLKKTEVKKVATKNRDTIRRYYEWDRIVQDTIAIYAEPVPELDYRARVLTATK